MLTVDFTENPKGTEKLEIIKHRVAAETRVKNILQVPQTCLKTYATLDRKISHEDAWFVMIGQNIWSRWLFENKNAYSKILSLLRRNRFVPLSILRLVMMFWKVMKF